MKVNAYRVDGQDLNLKDPIDITVRSLGSKFCAVKIDDNEYLVEGSHMIVAMQAACADAR
ncbi:MAG: hypothetical protein GWN64_05510 [Candidatus Thorarchaeota archaeon]|nr:hypothetical protein [Candidatus Thorarchaeota archaeon]